MVKRWAAERVREDYERPGCPKESTTDENVDLCTVCSFVTGEEACVRDIARQIGYVWGSSVYLERYLRDVGGSPEC